MKTLIEVPAIHELEQAPETGILGVLEHTLLVAASVSVGPKGRDGGGPNSQQRLGD